MPTSNREFVVGGTLLESPNVVYVDQVAQIGLGPFVTKLTFGTGTVQGEIPKPVITVVMPTNAVLTMCQHIVTVIGQDETKKGLVAELERYLAAIQA